MRLDRVGRRGRGARAREGALVAEPERATRCKTRASVFFKMTVWIVVNAPEQCTCRGRGDLSRGGGVSRLARPPRVRRGRRGVQMCDRRRGVQRCDPPRGPGVPAGGSVVDAGGLRRGANPRECAPITRRSGARRPRPPARGAHHPEGRFGDAEDFCVRRHIFVTEFTCPEASRPFAPSRENRTTRPTRGATPHERARAPRSPRWHSRKACRSRP